MARGTREYERCHETAHSVHVHCGGGNRRDVNTLEKILTKALKKAAEPKKDHTD